MRGCAMAVSSRAADWREDGLLHLQSTLLRSAEAVATTEQAPTSSWVASDIAVGAGGPGG